MSSKDLPVSIEPGAPRVRQGGINIRHGGELESPQQYRQILGYMHSISSKTQSTDPPLQP